MNREIRRFLIICLIAFISAFIVQTVFQHWGTDNSAWGGNPGWQREIAFWNVGAIVIGLGALRFGDAPALEIVKGFTVLFLLLGTNHLFAFVGEAGAPFHWPPLVLNYLGFLAGARVLLRYANRNEPESSASAGR